MVSLLLLASMFHAWAGDLAVGSVGAPVVVMKGSDVLGTTPFTATNLATGTIELGFRESTLGATVFTQKIYVPESGLTTLQVDLPGRSAITVVPSVAPTIPSGPVGDLYVTSSPAGAAIWLDGRDTRTAAPAMLRGLAVGKHRVQVRTDCTRAELDVVVPEGVIARSELLPVSGKGTVVVTNGPANARLLVDGTEVGKLPATLRDLDCGAHTVALRAPGYLEEQKSVNVLAFESQSIEFSLRKEEFGTLVLDVNPLDTAVTVDGIGVGSGPRTLDKIAAGSHQVAGSYPGYSPLNLDVNVPANEVARVNLHLLPVVEAPSALATLAANNAKESTTKASKGNGGRIALNVAVSAIGLAGVGVAAWSFTEQVAAFDRYQAAAAIPDMATADAIYTNEVQPAALRTYITGGIGLAALAGATALWVTTEF
jgi:hypothetical protein